MNKKEIIKYSTINGYINIMKYMSEVGYDKTISTLELEPQTKEVYDIADEKATSLFKSLSSTLDVVDSKPDSVSVYDESLSRTKEMFSNEAIKGNAVAIIVTLIPYLLDVLLILGFLGLLMFAISSGSDLPPYINYSIGSLLTIVTTIVSYHRGSSYGSKMKTDILKEKK